jgi:hypothetical protein
LRDQILDDKNQQTRLLTVFVLNTLHKMYIMTAI